ncbi:MAG TPA: polysaccharide deacetylase family protein [Bacillota bacterium]|jgi:peptidoglycan/xylan/chitin deacetylase (PgdA/CDA1 family)|nr:polysaccharide deacetylase family protein [Bacillota bacterium]HOA34939.1 polysaccharide deacetylase family protein [Bacillota bacterium]HOJ84817.1 polysaccharide deacetylase family protein [Bacillota bacterium]HPZ11096.1 polysaccharide deacetylase family protein [Bacillota bacterium]HQE09171.1 polysaccharide deacetylase family protein [Bacillota bacterium]
MFRSWRRAEIVGLCLIMLLGALLVTSALQQISPAPPAPVYFVPGSPSEVAITFETFWSSEGLEEVLRILREKDVRATFFLTGAWLKNHPEAAKMILEQGHEIGNHTMNHAGLLYLTEEEIRNEIDGFIEAAQEILEFRPVLFRPPQGLYNGIVLQHAWKRRCRTVLWSVESYDYLSRDAAELIARVGSRLQGGAIILFRAGTPVTLEALPQILELLREQGYSPVTVSALLDNLDRPAG